MIRPLPSMVFACALLMAGPASAQNWTIDRPGYYHLEADSIATGMFNIVINSPNVDLNLAGRTVRCAPPNPSTAVTFGVYSMGYSNVRVHNGRITGCFYGAHVPYGSNVRIENIDFTANTYIGLNIGANTGSNNIVRGNIFADIGGYTPEAYAIGINGVGSSTTVEGNTFRNIYRQAASSGVGEGVAILVSSNQTGVVIRNNWIQNDDVRANTYGIWVATGAEAQLYENSITNFVTGIAGEAISPLDNRLLLRTSVAGSLAIGGNSGTATRNVIEGYAVPIAGGVVAVDNIVH